MKQAVAIMVLILALVSASYAGNVSKAKDFIKAGMYPQAIELLDKEIHDNPTNAEAHFELGSCYVNQGRYGDADARFASAVRLKADYGYKIGSIYKITGLSAVDKGQTNEAINLLSKAITYQPDLKAGLVTDLMSKGKAAVQQGNYDNADVKLTVASNLEPTYKKEACDIYGQLGNSASAEKSVSFYDRASKYCNTYNDKAGNNFLELAKKMARTPGKDKERDFYKAKAANYLGNNIVEQELPDFKEFGAGVFEFGAFKKGEQLPFWLAQLRGDFSFNFQSTKGNLHFTVVTTKGEKFQMWDDKQRNDFCSRTWDSERYKIIFSEDMEFGWKLVAK